MKVGKIQIKTWFCSLKQLDFCCRRSTSEDDSDKKEEQETKQPKSVSQTIYADNRVRRKLRQTLYFVEYVSQIAQLVEYHLYRNALNTKSQSPKGQFIPLGKQTKWFGVHFVECGIETKVQTLLRSPSFLRLKRGTIFCPSRLDIWPCSRARYPRGAIYQEKVGREGERAE